MTEVSDYTGFPEMMEGRVKTLHPKVHGGLLARRDKEEHMRAAAQHKIEMIDLVVVNLYPFEETVAKHDVTFESAVENIDIGDPLCYVLQRRTTLPYPSWLIQQITTVCSLRWATKPLRKSFAASLH